MSEERRRGRRSFSLDLLRSVALLRIVTFHFSGQRWLTSVPALALMFWAAGELARESRQRTDPLRFLGLRGTRVLVPLAVYDVAALGVGVAVAGWAEVGWSSVIGTFLPVTSLTPVGVAAEGRGGWFAGIDNLWRHLWYIGVHLGSMVLAAFVLPHVRRSRAAITGVILGGLAVGVAADLAVRSGAATELQRVASVVIYMACFAVGAMGSHATMDAAVERHRWLKAVAPVTAIAATLATLSLSDSTPSVALALAGGTWIAAFITVRSTIDRWTAPEWVGTAVRWTTARLVTVYVWHMMALYLAVQAIRLLGVDPLANGATMLQMLLATLLAVPLVILFAPIERWSRQVARRSPDSDYDRSSRARIARFGAVSRNDASSSSATSSQSESASRSTPIHPDGPR